MFKNAINQPKQIANLALSKAAEFWSNELSNPSQNPTRTTILSYNPWSPPPLDWIKLNADDFMQNSMIGAGGCIRDDAGNWILGYSKYIGIGTTLQA